ncbi:Gfo/Idh/MocA family oxidoreductase [Nocardioides oleivorans]|uniref:Gfo/Idh/MocA family oxidoreductase n=1 Tax=Nocardioides oleivorans TaxID=273676 RepID=A0A4Q2RV16_9ACTN|nr:Gfo/Idh/MocA family oxidoreductase [Nocardioides oleivorans]RYB93001.1 Gfo/Idh/MocA family oxidoreductase [Nocardioides oleivorans]
MTTQANPSASRELGVAVIGYAFMGKAHSHAWRNVAALHPGAPGVRQQVLVGRDPDAVTVAAAQYGWAESATDWHAVLERDDIDVVDVCVPGHLHAEVAIAALEAGKHVIAEKPLANTMAEAEKMVATAQAARERGVHSMVGFNYRRVPALAAARQHVAAGRIGDVRQVRIAYLQDWLADEAAPMTWRLRRELAGSGALGDLASHAVDQVRFLLGQEITGVNALTETFVTQRAGASGPEEVTVDDAAWTTMRTSGGAVVSLEVTRMATSRKNALGIEVYGSTGAIRFDLERLNHLDVCLDGADAFSRVLVTEPGDPYIDGWWPPGHVLGWDATFTHQASDFLAALAAGQEPTPSFEDGLAVQRVLAAIEASAAQDGARVGVEQI